MATFFVRKTGSDANSGASAVLAKLTVGGAITAAASNDTIYIGAGVYRERITSTKTGITLQGDVDGVQTGDAGEVLITGWISGDTTRPATDASTLSLGRDWKLKKLSIKAGTLSPVGGKFAVEMNQSGSTVGSALIQDCNIWGDQDNAPLKVTTSFTFSLLNVLVERTFMGFASDCVVVQVGSSASGADKDVNLIFQNCIMFCYGSGNAGGGVCSITGLTNTFKSGGVKMYNCTVLPGHSPVMNTFGTSTSIPCEVKNCLILGWSDTSIGALLKADISGQLVENFNWIVGDAGIGSTGVYLNVTPGANTIANESRSIMFSVGQEYLFGLTPRPFFTPVLNGGPALGFGSDASVTLADDFIGRVRPSGGGSASKAVGALERHNTWVRETTTVRTGSNALRSDGPGDQEFDVAVDATSTTLSVWMRKDTNYTGTAPKFQIRNGTEAGVADTEATMSVAADIWEQLSLTFTPTSAGIITVRLLSQDTAGNGRAFADDRSGW